MNVKDYLVQVRRDDLEQLIYDADMHNGNMSIEPDETPDYLIRAQIALANQVQGWRTDFENAPRSREEFLTYSYKSKKYSVARRMSNKAGTLILDSPHINPTHWRPLVVGLSRNELEQPPQGDL